MEKIDRVAIYTNSDVTFLVIVDILRSFGINQVYKLTNLRNVDSTADLYIVDYNINQNLVFENVRCIMLTHSSQTPFAQKISSKCYLLQTPIMSDSLFGVLKEIV